MAVRIDCFLFFTNIHPMQGLKATQGRGLQYELILAWEMTSTRSRELKQTLEGLGNPITRNKHLLLFKRRGRIKCNNGLKWEERNSFFDEIWAHILEVDLMWIMPWPIRLLTSPVDREGFSSNIIQSFLSPDFPRTFHLSPP